MFSHSSRVARFCMCVCIFALSLEHMCYNLYYNMIETKKEPHAPLTCMSVAVWTSIKSVLHWYWNQYLNRSTHTLAFTTRRLASVWQPETSQCQWSSAMTRRITETNPFQLWGKQLKWLPIAAKGPVDWQMTWWKMYKVCPMQPTISWAGNVL